MNPLFKKRLEQEFINRFNDNPIVVFSPGRINLIGEHTDYNQGFVFPAAIDKGIYAAIQKSTAEKSTIVALDKNESYQFTLNTIIPETSNSWKNYVLGVLNEIQKKGKIISNFNLVFSGDIPSGAGLSSSAALENSVVFGLNALFNLDFSKEDMIYISQQAEHNFVGVKCGIMDQYASMFGQKDKAILLDCKTMKADLYPISFDGYEFVLMNTNANHSLAESAYNQRRTTCENIAELLKKESLRDVTKNDLANIKNEITEEAYQKALYVIQENERTLLAAKLLKTNTIDHFGKLLFDSHKGLSEQYEVSCKELDFLVKQAQKSSAVIGARMMGGGFGGCTINLVKSSQKTSFLSEVKQQYQQKFNHECSVYEVNISDGTRIISN